MSTINPLKFLKELKAATGQELNTKLGILWRLTEDDDMKIILGEEKYGLFQYFSNLLSSLHFNVVTSPRLPTPTSTLQNYMNDSNYLLALGCVWYLSRIRENKSKIGHRRYQIFHICKENLMLNNRYKEYSMNILINCSLDSGVHDYLFSKEMNYLEYCYQGLIQQSNDFINFIAIANAVSSIHETKHFFSFIEYDFISIFYQSLIRLGTNPLLWEYRHGGIGYWCLTFFIDLSSFRLGSQYLRRRLQPENLNFFLELLRFNGIESLKAACILSNIYGINHTDIDDSTPILDMNICSQCPHLIPTLREILTVTLNSNRGCSSELLDAGYVFGILNMKVITGTLVNLACHPITRIELLLDIHLIPLLLRALKLFIDDTPELSASLTHRAYAGGGGKDYETVKNCLLLLLHLSFDLDASKNMATKEKLIEEEQNQNNSFTNNQELNQKIKQKEELQSFLRNEDQVIHCLQTLNALSFTRKLPMESQQLIHILLERLNA